MNKPPRGICFSFFSWYPGSTDSGSSLFQQKCEVTCEGHIVPWLLVFSVSPGQIPMALGWEGFHTALLCVFTILTTLIRWTDAAGGC